MVSATMLSRLTKWSSWIIPGASFTVSAYSSITNIEFRPKLASDWSIALAALWVATSLFFVIFQVRPAPNARIVFPGIQVHVFFVCAIAALWLPYFIEPYKAQKVEIILDVSQRMGAEFNPPGTTKFDAARAGVLDILNYLEDDNVEVALRLINSSAAGQCQIEPQASLAVDFTRDFDQIRNLVNSLHPGVSAQAPVVDAIDFSIEHYLREQTFQENFYIYSFIGGDDTCGRRLGVYLGLPKVRENSVNADFYLIVLRGTGEEVSLRDLPNAKLDYASSVEQVQQIVNTNNRLIEVPTPTATSTPSLTGPESSPTHTLTTFAPAQEGQHADDIRPTDEIIAPFVGVAPSVTKKPALSPSMTPLPSPTKAPPSIPSSTPVPTKTPTNIPAATPMGPHTWTSLALQPEVFAPGCPLLNEDRVYAHFMQAQAGISAQLVNGGHTGKALRLDFSNISSASGNYAGWEVWLGANDYSGINLSSYNSLVFYIRGRDGNEEPNVYLMMPVLDDYDRYYKAVKDVTPVTTSWKRVEVPLVAFTLGQGTHEEVDLHNIQRIQILFEWYPEPRSGRIFIDDLCVE